MILFPLIELPKGTKFKTEDLIIARFARSYVLIKGHRIHDFTYKQKVSACMKIEVDNRPVYLDVITGEIFDDGILERPKEELIHLDAVYFQTLESDYKKAQTVATAYVDGQDIVNDLVSHHADNTTEYLHNECSNFGTITFSEEELPVVDGKPYAKRELLEEYVKPSVRYLRESILIEHAESTKLYYGILKETNETSIFYEHKNKYIDFMNTDEDSIPRIYKIKEFQTLTSLVTIQDEINNYDIILTKSRAYQKVREYQKIKK